MSMPSGAGSDADGVLAECVLELASGAVSLARIASKGAPGGAASGGIDRLDAYLEQLISATSAFADLPAQRRRQGARVQARLEAARARFRR